MNYEFLITQSLQTLRRRVSEKKCFNKTAEAKEIENLFFVWKSPTGTDDS